MLYRLVKKYYYYGQILLNALIFKLFFKKLINKKTDPKLFDFDMENIKLKEAT